MLLHAKLLFIQLRTELLYITQLCNEVMLLQPHMELSLMEQLCAELLLV